MWATVKEYRRVSDIVKYFGFEVFRISPEYPLWESSRAFSMPPAWLLQDFRSEYFPYENNPYVF
jgi:hypothetical protein